MTKSDLVLIVVSALIGGVVSGGGISALLYGALLNKLRDIFVTKDDLERRETALSDHINGFGDRATAAQNLAQVANDVAGAAHSKALETERETKYQYQAIRETLEHATGRFNAAADRMDDLFERVIYVEAVTKVKREA